MEDTEKKEESTEIQRIFPAETAKKNPLKILIRGEKRRLLEMENKG